ncbi:MAG: PAS domain S-box protein [Myxococcales bacterium]
MTGAGEADGGLDADGLEREELRSQSFESAMLPMVVMDAATHRFVDCNLAAARLYGHVSATEVLGKTPLDVSAPLQDGVPSAQLARHRVEQALAVGAVHFPWRHRRPDGTQWDAEVYLTRLDGNGRRLVQFTLIDVTERRRAEAALQESQRTLATLMSNLPGLAYRCENDADWTMRFASEGCLALTGLEPDELVGNRNVAYGNLIVPEDRERVWEEVQRALSARARWRIEYRLRTKGGEEKWVWEQGCGILDAEGRLTALEGFVTDITERRRAEEDRGRLREQLHQAQKVESVGRLAGGVAHDFNNMLGVILGRAELALERLGPESPVAEDLKEILQAAQRSADLTRQLLAFARKQTIAPKVLDLNDTVGGMLKMLRRLIGEHLELAWTPEPGDWRVLMDPAQLDQVLANLCINARDAIGNAGKVTIETGVATFDAAYCSAHPGHAPGDYVLLVVSDDGCGMDKQTLDRLFEPFFTTKGLGRGVGLGLATVFGIVKQNHGFINAYSEPGKGSTFRIYLPRHLGEVQPSAPRPDEPVRGEGTILLVEDEPALLKLTTRMLQSLGYTVLQASAPSEAMRVAGEQARTIDLLMTDVVLPEMNGKDLATLLTARHPRLRCLFTSGYTADVIAHQGVLDEGVHFIEKPCTLHALADKVREALTDRPACEKPAAR